MKLYNIKPKGTALENLTFECIALCGGYYAPKEHVIFYPYSNGDFGWDKAIFPDWDTLYLQYLRLLEERKRLGMN